MANNKSHHELLITKLTTTNYVDKLLHIYFDAFKHNKLATHSTDRQYNETNVELIEQCHVC